MRALVLAMLACAASACVGDAFIGDENRILFSSNMGRPYEPWTPGQPVAVGSRLAIGAYDYRGHDPDGGAVAPRATPSLDDGGLFSDVDAGVDRFTARVNAEGRSRIDWAGLADDHFTIHAREAVRGHVQDPISATLARQPLSWIPRDAGWRDVGSDFLLTAGKGLYVEVAVFDDAGTRLAQSPALVQAQVNGPLHARAHEEGLVLSSDGGAGELSDVALMIEGKTVSTFRVRTASTSEVVQVDLHTVVAPPYVLVKATARIDGGEPLWQAPVRWAFDPHFAEVATGNDGKTPVREDLIVLQWDPGDAGTIRAPIYAGVGGIEVMLELEIPVKGDLTTFTEGPVYEPRPCQCGTTPGIPLLLGALLLIRRRR